MRSDRWEKVRGKKTQDYGTIKLEIKRGNKMLTVQMLSQLKNPTVQGVIPSQAPQLQGVSAPQPTHPLYINQPHTGVNQAPTSGAQGLQNQHGNIFLRPGDHMTQTPGGTGEMFQNAPNTPFQNQRKQQVGPTYWSLPALVQAAQQNAASMWEQRMNQMTPEQTRQSLGQDNWQSRFQSIPNGPIQRTEYGKKMGVPEYQPHQTGSLVQNF